MQRMDTATTGVETAAHRENAMIVLVLNMVVIAALVAKTLVGAHAVVQTTKTMVVRVITGAHINVKAVVGVVSQVKKKPL